MTCSFAVQQFSCGVDRWHDRDEFHDVSGLKAEVRQSTTEHGTAIDVISSV